MCPNLGRDCLPWVSSTFLDQVHASMVLNFGEFIGFCFGSFQYAEDASAYIPRSGDGCCFHTIEELVGIDGVA